VRTTVQKQPGRGRSQPPGRFVSDVFDAGPGDYAHNLGCSLRTRQGARPIAG
jgi:hypothetical protein